MGRAVHGSGSHAGASWWRRHVLTGTGVAVRSGSRRSGAHVRAARRVSGSAHVWTGSGRASAHGSDAHGRTAVWGSGNRSAGRSSMGAHRRPVNRAAGVMSRWTGGNTRAARAWSGSRWTTRPWDTESLHIARRDGASRVGRDLLGRRDASGLPSSRSWRIDRPLERDGGCQSSVLRIGSQGHGGRYTRGARLVGLQGHGGWNAAAWSVSRLGLGRLRWLCLCLLFFQLFDHIGSCVPHDRPGLSVGLLAGRAGGRSLFGSAEHAMHGGIRQALAAFDAVLHLGASRLRALEKQG